MRRNFILSTVLAAFLGCFPIQAAMAETALPDYIVEAFGNPPAVPEGPLDDNLARAVRTVFVDSVSPIGSETQFFWGRRQEEAILIIAGSNDARLAWLITDLMRFVWQDDVEEQLSSAAGALLERTWQPGDSWDQIINHLIAWDIPAPPDYLTIKRGIYTDLLYGWERLFVEGDIDWRYVTWGGVRIDARPYDETDTPCSCIPAADNPQVTSADEATWLSDDDIIFGIEINGEARAYPRQIMEVREMVNDTLGGRDLGIPYCTLCGAAQAYFTDELPDGIERIVLRTSGLLHRSNKVMYDLNTSSIFDTFTGVAVTGPLAESNLVLQQATVVTSDWGSWREAYPNTTVLAEHLALGLNYDFRGGRDANGPIFPVGDVDPRLPIQEDVIGVINPAGDPVAFPRGPALLALIRGNEIQYEGVVLEQSAGGLRAFDESGAEIASHQAFWFAWSQFHPNTALWGD